MKNLIAVETMIRAPWKRGVNNNEVMTPVEKRRNRINQIGSEPNGTKHDRLRLVCHSREVHETNAKEIQIINNNPKMIFIVEDNTLYAKSLQYYLEDRLPDSEIRVFSLGESCIDNLDPNPDYIIMDYFLNSKEYNALDGLNTIRTIRKKNINSRIIVLSSQQNMDVTVEAVKYHHCNYVVKNETAFEKVYNLMKENK